MGLDGGPLMLPAKIAMSYRGKEGEDNKAGVKDTQGEGGMDCKDMQAVAERNKAAIRAAGGRI